MICPVCKHEVDGSFEICSNCGAMLHQPVQEQPQQPVQASQQLYSAPMPPQGQPQQRQAPPQGYMPRPALAYPQGQSASPKPDGKKRKTVIIVIIAAVVAIAAIVAVFGISHSLKGDDKTASVDYHTDIENDMKRIQDDFMIYGRVPSWRYNALIDAQCKYLEGCIDSVDDERNISSYNKTEAGIAIRFGEDDEWTYTPSDYFVEDTEEINPSSYDYSALEKDLKKYQLKCLGGEMLFRGTADGIYYTDSQYIPAPSKIIKLDRETQTTSIAFSWDAEEYDPVNVTLCGDSAYVVDTTVDSKHLLHFDTGYKVVYTEDRACVDTCGDDIFSMSDYYDLYFNNEKVCNLENSGANTENVFVIKGEVFVQYTENYTDYYVSRLTADGTLEKVAKMTRYKLFIDDKGFYYNDGMDIHYYNALEEKDSLVTTVTGCKADEIYIDVAYGDRVYYHGTDNTKGKYLHNIYYSDINDGKAHSIASGVTPYGGA